MSDTSVESRLRDLGIELPPAPKAVGAYVTVIRTGNLVVTSGQLPWKGDKLLFTGKLVDAREAQRVGLINRAVPDAELEGAVMELAEQMSQVPPEGIRLNKEALNTTIEIMGNLNAAFRYHSQMNAISRLLERPDDKKLSSLLKKER